MRFTRIFIYLLACSVVSHAQRSGQRRVDSLQQLLQASKEDTSRVAILEALSFEWSHQDPDTGRRYGEQSLALARKLRSAYGAAWALNAIAQNDLAAGRHSRALESLFQSLQGMESIDNKQGISTVTGNIGNIYYLQGNGRQALVFYNRALAAARTAPSRPAELVALAGIGNVYFQQESYQDAVNYLTQAVELARALHEEPHVARNLGNLANAYAALRRYPEAIRFSSEALAMAEQAGNKTLLAISNGNLGELYLRMVTDSTTGGSPAARGQKLEPAILYLVRGIEGCRAAGYPAPITEFGLQLATAYRLAGRHQAALEIYEQTAQLKDSIFSADTKLRITHLETEREVALKNKQIELDRLSVAKKRNERGFFIAGIALLLLVTGAVFRNYRVQKDLNGQLSVEKRKVEKRTDELSSTLQDLRATQAQLIEAERHKENELIRGRISQDIHDDISSELSRISWTGELAKAKVKGEDYRGMPELMDRITSSSRETVSKLGEIIWTINPQHDSLAALLAYMRAHIGKQLADVDIACAIDFPEEGTGMAINPELKRALYLVMKEALHNAMKYAGAANIRIAFLLSEDQAYRLCIRDDGQGMEPGVVSGGGNGLTNMRRRMEQVGGECVIGPAPGKGTEVCCTGVLY